MLEVAYEKMVRMEPRPGTTFSTIYVKQTAAQRLVLTKHIEQCVRELIQVVTVNADWQSWITVPLKEYKTTSGVNRSCLDIINDLFEESRGRKKNGELKDYALAPIDRWNKLFKDTDYAFELVRTEVSAYKRPYHYDELRL